MKTHELVFREVDKARFEEVQDGTKPIETRAGTEKYQEIEVGDKINFVCGDDSFAKEVVKKYHWPTPEAILEEVSLAKVMPGLHSIEEVWARYASYPNYVEKIKEFGILGFELE